MWCRNGVYKVSEKPPAADQQTETVPTIFYKGDQICLLGNVHQDCEKQLKQSHWLKDMRKELCASFLDLLWVHLATCFEL